MHTEYKIIYKNLWNESPMGKYHLMRPIGILIDVGIVVLCCSCTTKRQIEYIDREVVKYQKEVVHDTLVQHTHDSVYHTIFQKGDTVYDTKYVEKTRWRDRIVEKKDTVVRDSIVTEYKETTKEVRYVPKIYKYSLAFSIFVIIFAFVKLYRWLKPI